MYLEQFKFLSSKFLDDRLQYPYEFAESLFELNKSDLEQAISRIWDLSCQSVSSVSYVLLPEIIAILESIERQIRGKIPYVPESIREFIDAIPHIAKGQLNYPTPLYSRWWGRGLQYLGLRRS